jgi:hypothetical protein
LISDHELVKISTKTVTVNLHHITHGDSPPQQLLGLAHDSRYSLADVFKGNIVEKAAQLFHGVRAEEGKD